MKLVVNRASEPLPVPAPVEEALPVPAPAAEAFPVPAPVEQPFPESAPAEETDPISAFASETDPPPATPSSRGFRVSGRLLRRVTIVLLSLVLVGAAAYAGLTRITAARVIVPPPEARLVVSSNPAGAEVLIDGVPRGATPVSLGLPVGPHRLTVRTDHFSRDVHIDARAHVELLQHVEIAVPPAPAPPASPEPEPAPRPQGPAAGTLIVTSPIEVQLFQGTTLIGSSQAARLLLPAGRHPIRVVNEALGFDRAVTVEVLPGGTTRLPIALPSGVLSVNAQPWADVFIDGRPVGQTPLANVSLPIGSHDLVFRHPELGERSQTVVVVVGKPTRVGMDLRK